MAKALGLPRDSGIIISDVAPHGSAEAAGLRTGDIITGVDGKPTAYAWGCFSVWVGSLLSSKNGALPKNRSTWRGFFGLPPMA